MLTVLFSLALAGSAAPAATAGQNAPPSVPACRFTPPPSAEPPAWLLLCGALVLVGAGRLASR